MPRERILEVLFARARAEASLELGLPTLSSGWVRKPPRMSKTDWKLLKHEAWADRHLAELPTVTTFDSLAPRLVEWAGLPTAPPVPAELPLPVPASIAELNVNQVAGPPPPANSRSGGQPLHNRSPSMPRRYRRWMDESDQAWKRKVEQDGTRVETTGRTYGFVWRNFPEWVEAAGFPVDRRTFSVADLTPMVVATVFARHPGWSRETARTYSSALQALLAQLDHPMAGRRFRGFWKSLLRGRRGALRPAYRGGDDDIDRLIAAAEGRELLPALLTGRCALRPEAYVLDPRLGYAGMRWEQVDIDAGLIRYTTKGGEDRQVPLVGDALATLTGLKRGKAGSELVYPYCYSTARADLTAAATRATLPNASVARMLRRTKITAVAQAFGDPYVSADFAGHREIGTHYRFYYQANPERLRAKLAEHEARRTGVA